MSDSKYKGWEYKVTSPELPPGAENPEMGNRDIENWLNYMDGQGWEFVGYAQKVWNCGFVQQWWIFRRPRKT